MSTITIHMDEWAAAMERIAELEGKLKNDGDRTPDVGWWLTQNRRAMKAEAELARVDANLARRPALDALPDRCSKISKAITAASKSEAATLRAERAEAELDEALTREKRLREALTACRSFLNDPGGFAEVTISDTVWVRDGMTLLDWVEGALLATAPVKAALDGQA